MAYLEGVYGDVVLSAAGVPVVGASVALYRVEAWAAGVLPVGSPPSPAALYSSVYGATTDASGSFSIRGIWPGDYHVLVTYTPPGGSPVVVWRYGVPIAPAGAGLRLAAEGLERTIPRAMSHLRSGGALTVCCIGDGVTVGYNATGTVTGGWAYLLAARLAADYPAAGVSYYYPTSYASSADEAISGFSALILQSQGAGASIGIINAGMIADSVLRAVRRLDDFGRATWFPAPDLYLVSLGLAEMKTDTTTRATAADYGAALVGLVGLLRASGAEVVLLTPHAGPIAGGAPVAGGVFDDYCAAVRAAASVMGCGVVDVRQRWLDHYSAGAANDGYGTWLDTSGGDHAAPTDAGHDAIAQEVQKLFGRPVDLVPQLGTAAGAPGGVAPVGSQLERVRLLNTSPTQLVFTGTWAATANAVFASGREYTSSTAGDTVTFSARFTDLVLLAGRWHDGGRLEVTVDSALWGTIDLYRANPLSTVDLADYHGAIIPQEQIFLAGPLADIVHTVSLKVLATANGSSSGHACRIDALDCLRVRQPGQVLETVTPLQRVMSGSGAVTLTAQASNSATVNFPQSFPNGAPVVALAVTGTDQLYCAAVSGATAAHFTLNVFTRDGANHSATVTVNWVAVG